MIESYGIALYKDNKILLCKSSLSFKRWGLVKGSREEFESIQDCAIREFWEETSIKIEKKYLEKYFEQKNKYKIIGVWMVNFYNIKGISKYFKKDCIKDKYISPENSKIKFFDIDNLPLIKKKQTKILKDIKKFLKE